MAFSPEGMGPDSKELGLDDSKEKKELIEKVKEVLMEFKGSIPKGEKWNCGTVMDSDVVISDGAEMYIGSDGEMMDSKITVQPGGKFSNEGVDMGNKIEYAK